ncbi:MAG: hypothetical protein GY791_13590 [Alphaproteobacteria bacterium]|nr:hypothetical protein [Alphaproteobacteria bacterium]
MQSTGGLILVSGLRLEGHLVIFLALQTHLSCHFLLAIDSLKVPNHSTFSVSRHGRFREDKVFRLVSESIVGQCMAAGLVGSGHEASSIGPHSIGA